MRNAILARCEERGGGDLGKKYKKRGRGGVDKKLDKYTRM